MLDEFMRLVVVHVGDEADAAGVMLVARVIEALGGGKPLAFNKT